MRQIASGLLAAALISTTAAAQETGQAPGLVQQVRRAATQASIALAAPGQGAAAAPAPKKVTLLVGADMPLLKGYLFRGIVQEFDPKFTIQPYADVGVAVSDTLTINVGTWNSLHTGSIKDNLGAWYESDVYASATFAAGRWKPGVLYTLYTSPAGGYEGVGDDGSIGVSEIVFFASYDDSGMTLPLSPKFVLAFETSETQADFGAKKGVYFEAGIKPTFKSSDDAAVTFAVPVKIGTSLKDYYEFGTGDDSKFGYVQVGANASVPLSFFRKGSWEAHGGIDFILLAEKLRFLQDGEDEAAAVKPVLSFGFSATF